MPDLKKGVVVSFRELSPLLVIFRLAPENGSPFPSYSAGQYIALRRDRCRLTKKFVEADGRIRYVPDVDAAGNPKLGPVTHSYSIASAPFESDAHGNLEFYVVLEKDEYGTLGRLSSSFFELSPASDRDVMYVNRITGNFTLDKTANGFTNVVLVGTGTGLAPFVSMIKQLDHEASRGAAGNVQYTLLHTNRTYEELAYHEELVAIEAAQRFDFVYVASVSRPSERDLHDSRMGRGRANNVLRHILGMPLKEEEELQAVLASGADASKARAALERTVKPALPSHISRSDLLKRFDPPRTILLTCGNPGSMDDIKHAADSHHIRFEKEDW